MPIHDVNSANFQQVVIDGSQQTPVLVDFWAPWCEPCKVLKPLLEKLAREYAGKFVLAKINTEENQELALQFQIRSIPSVKVVYQGKVVNEFTGAQPETSLRAFIDSILPSPADNLVTEAITQRENSNLQQARDSLEQALQQDAEHVGAKLALADILLEQGEFKTCRELLDSIALADQLKDDFSTIKSRLQLAEESQDLPTADELRLAIQQNDNDLDARLSLATVLINQQDYAEAAELLLEVIRRDKNYRDEAGRKKLLALFELLGNQDELVRSARKTLARLLN